ncbi:50S ribosomal protein L21 [Buchnera aphidicola (Melanaphis sacchari)]|uniref:Large ribosomal subunit protein bL21 n=1 Tax=Buchnera aphidicola (Melanaphis sacchari) TaxID=2173854 RepID=A0A2U8DF07_9GAMM|nr:50S ribosomal protein L21 [Buchnera aphidicola]AWH90409.1 50S ribosomal protein L21 [Buchnera aphidicola (Melanaphis sacchari)]
MYAVFISGGKQYRVRKNQTIQLEKLKKLPGETIEFNDILMISDKNLVKIGNPFLLKSTVEGYIESHVKSKKIKIIKFHRRKHYKKQQGHRQNFTNVKIIKINYHNEE